MRSEFRPSMALEQDHGVNPYAEEPESQVKRNKASKGLIYMVHPARLWSRNYPFHNMERKNITYVELNACLKSLIIYSMWAQDFLLKQA